VLAGAGLYLLSSVVVTLVFNVRLNDALAGVSPDSRDGSEVWARYLSTWTAWNHVRTVGSIIAAASFMFALREP
jgi:uncharacterized membrane protein